MTYGMIAVAPPARRGEYRVIYTIQAHIVTVTILRVAHRRDAYC